MLTPRSIHAATSPTPQCLLPGEGANSVVAMLCFYRMNCHYRYPRSQSTPNWLDSESFLGTYLSATTQQRSFILNSKRKGVSARVSKMARVCETSVTWVGSGGISVHVHRRIFWLRSTTVILLNVSHRRTGPSHLHCPPTTNSSHTSGAATYLVEQKQAD